MSVYSLEATSFGNTEAEQVASSIAISLKRIADALDSSEDGGRVQGSVLYWLETIASAAVAGNMR